MGKRLFWILTGVLSCLVLTVGALNIMKFAKAGTNRFENTKLVVYEGPKSLRDATPEDLKAANEQQRDIALLHCTDTKVSVNGTELYVYDTNVNHSRNWNSSYLPTLSRTPITYFDFEFTPYDFNNMLMCITFFQRCINRQLVHEGLRIYYNHLLCSFCASMRTCCKPL